MLLEGRERWYKVGNVLEEASWPAGRGHMVDGSSEAKKRGVKREFPFPGALHIQSRTELACIFVNERTDDRGP